MKAIHAGPKPGIRHGKTFLVVRTRTYFACLLHWILFLAVVTLVITGFYIGNPGWYVGEGEAYNAFAMANMRQLHFYAATGMIVSLFLRLYLAFTPAQNNDIKEFLPTPWNIKHAIMLAYHYATMKKGAEHFRFVNPLGGIGIFLMTMSMLLMIATGFLLYLPAEYLDNVIWKIAETAIITLGGHQNVRLIHHTTMYFIIFLVVIHVYFQIWKNMVFSESDISSIIGGYKVFPLDEFESFADHYGLRLHEHIPDAKERDRESTPMKKGPD